MLPVVGKVLDDMPAKSAGLEVGDRVQAINGRPIQTWDELTKTVYGSPGRPVELRVDRAGETETIRVTPVSKDI